MKIKVKINYTTTFTFCDVCEALDFVARALESGSEHYEITISRIPEGEEGHV